MNKPLLAIAALLLMASTAITAGYFYLEGRIATMQERHISGRIATGALPIISNSAGDVLEITSLEPAPPATLKAGENIRIKFRYQLSSASQVCMFAKTKIDGSKPKGCYASSGSDTYQKGSGNGEYTITHLNNSVTNEIEVYMMCFELPVVAYSNKFRGDLATDRDLRLLTMVVPASYTWVETP